MEIVNCNYGATEEFMVETRRTGHNRIELVTDVCGTNSEHMSLFLEDTQLDGDVIVDDGTQVVVVYGGDRFQIDCGGGGEGNIAVFDITQL